MEEKNKKYDCIVIGGGPAGVTAAVYVVRGGKSVLLIHNDDSALKKAERIQNYYGIHDVSGAELYEAGINQAAALGVSVLLGEVARVVCDGENFRVAANKAEFFSKRLVLAVGAARQTVNIDGIKQAEGKGVSYCAVCDGFFYRKKRVAVIGAGEYAEHEYSYLKGIASSAALLTDGKSPVFQADNVIQEKISRVDVKDGGGLTVVFQSGATLDVDGLFVAAGVMGSFGLSKSLGIMTDDKGGIKTDGRGMTNIPGLYAAGDCTIGIKQIGKAVSDGITAGMSVLSDLKRGGSSDA